MAIKPQSAKRKGKTLQNWVRDRILEALPKLEPDDVKSTSMGAGGEDVQLSPAARRSIPISVECKAKKQIAVYRLYEQAVDNAPPNTTPVLVVKADRKKPLAVVDAAWFIKRMAGNE